MKVFSYDFDLTKENKLTKDLPAPGFRRNFQDTLESFVSAMNSKELKTNPQVGDILGRFLAAHSPIFTFFLLAKIQEKPLRDILIRVFKERPIHLESLKTHCNKVLGGVIKLNGDVLTPLAKRHITLLANDLCQLTEADIRDVGHGHSETVNQQLTDKSLLAYEKAFSKCLSATPDGRDLAILIYSFVAGASSEQEFANRLSTIRMKTMGWGDYRRKVYNCLSAFKDFAMDFDTDATGICIRTVNKLLDMLEPMPISEMIHALGRNQSRGYGHQPRVYGGNGMIDEATWRGRNQNRGYNQPSQAYGSAPRIDGFSQLDITDLVDMNHVEAENEIIFVKINYNRISGSSRETKVFHAARAAIDFLLEFRNFRNDGERSVQTLASLVSYFDPRANPHLIHEAVSTFKANTSLLNKNELYWAYVALIPWLPTLPNNTNNPSIIAMYNKFRQEVKDYVANFHQ